MKLYATTTSERASKSQGGNEYINIIVNDDNENIMLDIAITPRKFEISNPLAQIRYNHHLTDIKINEMANDSSDFWGVKDKTKAEKKKAECQHNYCDDDAICITCGKQQ